MQTPSVFQALYHNSQCWLATLNMQKVGETVNMCETVNMYEERWHSMHRYSLPRHALLIAWGNNKDGQGNLTKLQRRQQEKVHLLPRQALLSAKLHGEEGRFH